MDEILTEGCMKEERVLMKDGLGAAALERSAAAIERCMPGFPKAKFLGQALDGLDALELKERVHHVIAVLAGFLPADFPDAAQILARLPGHWDGGDPDNPLRGFAAWPLIDYTAVYGLDHPDTALDLLRDLTVLFSAEFAVRPFIRLHPETAYAHMTQWCDHTDPHVRRLASEGNRPRLPWGERLPGFIADPSPVLALLEKLKDDPSEYVRRSVANNLNDISKDHPELVLQTCYRWLDDASDERRWIVRHATRTLVKSGHPDVFPLLGYTENPEISVESFRLEDTRVALGDALAFRFALTSTSKAEQKIVLDYGIHFMKANGTQNRKVFKLKSVTLKPGEVVEITKRHPIKPITTRTYYPGEHKLEVLVNGVGIADVDFLLQT